MTPIGFLISGLGASFATRIAAKAVVDRLKGPSPLMVVYANFGEMMARPFRDHGKAVEFQRELSKRHMASLLVLADANGNLSSEPIVAMSGLGDTWISSNYALPKGQFSSAVLEPGKQGKDLIKVSEYDAQAWADEYGAHPPIETTATKDLYPPFYRQSYGSTYHTRMLPKDIYGSTFYGDGYNLVNTGNLGNT